ncbi:MAG TPA: VOC family protein [Candidatus Limnocylindria bacterium]|nr:VOC family protein [Candidatus Limnocylindria bacterium]
MFDGKRAFSSYSVDDLAAAGRFYGQTLGLTVGEEPEMGLLSVQLAEDKQLMLYSKENHAPATYTVLNLPVDDIDAAVDELARRGVRFERYEGFEQDEKGIARPPSPEHGPPIAWFTDPAGNVLAVLEIPE